jgi:hypothetical protein
MFIWVTFPFLTFVGRPLWSLSGGGVGGWFGMGGLVWYGCWLAFLRWLGGLVLVVWRPAAMVTVRLLIGVGVEIGDLSYLGWSGLGETAVLGVSVGGGGLSLTVRV